MSKKDGGAAFPRPFSKSGNFSDSPRNHAQDGMTLRDYFAAKAMQGFMSRTLIPAFDEEMISERSYAVADAMIAAREVSK